MVTIWSFLPFSRYYVVDSVGGDEDRAVDALLAMSDPDHVPTHEATPEQPSVVRRSTAPLSSILLFD